MTTNIQSDSTKNNKLWFNLNDKNILLASVGFFIFIGYFISMLPIGSNLHITCILILIYAIYITSKLYVVDIIWCEGIILINGNFDKLKLPCVFVI